VIAILIEQILFSQQLSSFSTECRFDYWNKIFL